MATIKHAIPLAAVVTDVGDAWAAGLFEGEGHVSLGANRAGGPKVYPRMVLQLTDLDVLAHFHEIVGVGHLYTTTPDPRAAYYKPLHRWETGRRDTTAALFERFRPHLGQRRTEQFETVLRGAYK